jgi:three-Cys-motif partner protein
MGDLVDGDDGLPASEVHNWVYEKHRTLLGYLEYQAKPRQRWLSDPRANGATYIDVFCGPGRSRVHEAKKFVDGSAVAAWRASVEQGAPFTSVFIADKDDAKRRYCAERLRRLNAPVVEIEGDADTAAHTIAGRLNPYGLHFAFVDPYSLGALRLTIIRSLARLQRMDLLVHISAMDLFRNLDMNLARKRDDFDDFAPGWRDAVDAQLRQDEQRRAILTHWKNLVDTLGFDTGAEMQSVRNSQNRDLYWLLLVSRHDLAKKFWKIVQNNKPQRGLFDKD